MNPQQAEVYKLFKELKKEAAAIEALPKTTLSKHYELVENFNKKFLAFMRNDWSFLNAKQILSLCRWESKWRGVPLHVFLMHCSNMYDLATSTKTKEEVEKGPPFTTIDLNTL